MKECPRRTLLGGIGTTVTVALAGNAATAADERSATADTDESDDSTFESVLEYLPASVAEDSMMLETTDVERQLEADEPHERRPFGGPFEIDPESVSTMALVRAQTAERSRPIEVLAGDIELEGDAESRETDGGVAYEFYETGDVSAGAADGVVVLAGERATIEDAFDAGAGEADRLLETESLLREALETYDDVDGCHVRIGDDETFYLPVDVDDERDDVVRYLVHGTTVLDPDTIEVKYGIEFADESLITDELIDALEADLGYAAVEDEPTAEIDDSLVTVTITRDLELERAVREHDSPGSLRAPRDVDPDDDVLELEVGRGDPAPIDDLTLELDDEEYDREIWADGRGKLEEGDTIEIDTDDVEPNLSVTLRHDHELGSSASGTTILSHFRFAFDYDVDRETLTVEYADDFPLDGDAITLAAYEEYPHYRPDEGEPEPRVETQPWAGETLSNGDEGTLEGVTPGDRVIVGWDGTSSRDAVGRYRARPPGRVRFDYEYETETLSATLELEDERPADEYELLVDDEPADAQWTDAASTVESGATIEVADVPIGSDVTVVWGDDARVGGTRPQPRIELALDDADVEHVSGDTLPASKLRAEVWTGNERLEIDLDERIDGDFEPGDGFTVDADEINGVTLIYDGQYRIGYAYPAR